MWQSLKARFKRCDMPIDITEHTGFLLINAGPGLNFWQLLEGIFNAGYVNTGDCHSQIWMFPEGPVDIKFEDLFQIKDNIRMRYPRSATRRKFAIVAERGFVAVIAEYFVKIADDLPCEIRFFHAYQDAYNWVATLARQEP